jgi:VWFA-related protein
MNSANSQNIRATRQGRGVDYSFGQGLLTRPFRSLNLGLSQLRYGLFGNAPLLRCMNALATLLIVVVSCVPLVAQEVDDTIRIKTRVVFLDALVKDKKTSLPISNLALDNFEVLDNGKPRPISYFTREGQARKPLALILILDLRADGAGRFLKKAEILKSMEDELAKLPPGDEVAIMAMDIGEDEKRFWLTEFTNDRTKLAAALARVPRFAEENADPEDATLAAGARTEVKESQPAADASTAQQKPDDIVETETIKGKNGAVITRTIRRDGSVDLKRVNKNGEITIAVNDVYDMAAAVKDATRKAEQSRPNSQVSVVWVSDGIAPIFFEDRDATEQILIRNNVIFNSLTVEMRTLFKLLMPIGKPIAGWVGVSLYGSAKHLALRSGGEAVKVGRVKDYGAGLSRIIGNLTARYSLGFALAEDETDDGRMHNLEVRVKAKDEKGKNRKLLVSSRQGYYMSTSTPKEAAVKAQ